MSKRNGAFGQKGYFAIPLTFPMAAGLLVILLAAVAWAFFMGLMVGRGQNPEAGLAQLTGLQLEESRQNIEAAENQDSGPVEAAPAANQETQKDAGQFSRPSGEQMAAWPGPETGKPAASQPASDKSARQASQTPRRQKTARAQGPKFDYVFQVAAFRSSREAERLREKLDQAGARCRTSKSGKVYLVIASLRGTAADEQALMGKLKDLKLGKPLLLSKKEAPKGGGRKK